MMSKKRIVALLLTIMMVVQLLPTTVLAEGWRVATSNAIVGEEYYTVNYDMGTVKTITQYVLQGNSPVVPEDPTREGYAFDGWGDPVITQDTDGTAIYTYTAKWKQIDRVLVTIRYQTVTIDDEGKQEVTELATPFQRFYTRDDINTIDAASLTVDSPEVIGLYPNYESVVIDLAAAFEQGTLDAVEGYYTYPYTVTYQQANADYTLVHWVEDEAGTEVYEGVHYRKVSEETKSHVAGATVAPTALAEVPEGYTFIGGPSVKLTADGTNTVNAYYQSNINFLLFDTQGGAYIAAKSAKVGTSVELPTAERMGYQFTGWYTDEACTQLVNGTSIVMPTAATTTLYAGWEGKQVSYQVVYWLEKANLDHDPVVGTMSDYAFFSAENRTAVAGTTVTANATDTARRFTTTEVNGDTARSNPVAQYQGVQSVTVDGDGTTVLNVFYSRIKFTFIFSLGDNYRFYFNDKTSTFHEGSEYKITVKYEQDISALWPSSANATFQHYTSSGRWPNQTWSWEDTTLRNWGGSYVSHRWTVNAELLPTSSDSTSRTYSANFGSTSEHTVTYWVEGIAGENINNYPSYTDKNTTTNGGKTYWKHYTSQTIYIQDGLSPKDIEGFVSNSSSSSSNTDINFYYSRRSYTLSFDPQGGTASVASSTVPFEKKLTSYQPTAYVVGTTTKEVNGVPYVFIGWYYEPECKTPVAWNTDQMPAKHLQLYAGWERVPAVVHVHPNYDGADKQTIDVNVGDRLSALPADSGFVAEPQREGYTFAGWYMDAACTEPYSLNDPLSETTTNIYAKWEKAPVSYTVYYLDAAEPHAPVHAPKVVTGNEWGTTATEYYVAVNGMRPDAISKSCDLVADETQNVITFYYSSAELHYTVYYGYYIADGEWKDVILPTTKGPVLADRVVEIAQASITDTYGKMYRPVDAYQSLELVSDSSQNIIRFVVVPYTEVPVKVEHYIQYWDNGVIAEEYELHETEDRGSAVIGQSVVSESYKKTYTGYTYNHAAQKVVTVDNTTGAVTVQLYYNLRTNLSYTVNYLEQGTNTELSPAKTVGNQVFGAEVTETAIDIAGYNPVEPTSQSITIAVSGNEITFYYTKRTDLSYMVKYLEKDTEKELHTAKTEGNQVFNAEVTEEAIDIPGYNKVEPTSATIHIAVDAKQNVITFYYTKRTDLKYTVNFYRNDARTTKVRDSETIGGKTFQEKVTETPWTVEGFTAVPNQDQTITIEVTGNVINFYYYENVTLVANSLETIYNGQEQSVAGYTGQPEGAVFEGITVGAKGTTVDTYPAKFASDTIGTVDKTGGYIVTGTTDGNLTINPRPVTITVNTDAHTYTGSGWTVAGEDGLEYTVSEYDEDNGLLPDDEISLNVVYNPDEENSKTLVGEYTAIVLGGIDGVSILNTTGDVTNNYAVKVVPGILTITDDTNHSNVVTKTHAAGTYMLGDTVTFTITVTNIYNETRTITIIEQDGVTFVETTGATITGTTAVFEDVEAGATVSIQATYTITEQDILKGSFTNSVTVKFDDTDEFETTDEVNTDNARSGMSVTKVVANKPAKGETYDLGETIEYEITVANTGNLTISNIVVTDSLADATILEGTDYTVKDKEAMIASLLPNTSVVIKAKYTVTEADILAQEVVNSATATGTDSQNNSLTDTGSVTVDTDEADYSLLVEKRAVDDNGGELPADKKFALNETIRYIITVKNTGNQTQTNVLVKENLQGATITEGTMGADGYAQATIAEIKPGQTVTLHAEYTVQEKDIQAGKVANSVTANGSDGTDEHPTDDPKFSLSVDKKATNEPTNGKTFALGETIRYEITVINDGNQTQWNVVVEEKLQGAIITEGTMGENGYAQATIAEIKPGQKVTLHAKYTVQEKDIQAGKVANSVTANGSTGTDEKETDKPNNSLKLEKAVTSTPENGKAYKLGETITYTITVTNDGNQTLENIVVTDVLPDAVIQAGAGYTVENNTAKISKLAAVPEGQEQQSVTVYVQYTVTEEDILMPYVRNSATATADDNEFGSNVVQVATDEPNNRLDIKKEATNKPASDKGFALGETIKYTITVTNDGNLTMKNIVVTDELKGAIITEGTVNEEGYAEATIAELKPGMSATLYATYTVTSDDILAGKVVNAATVKGEGPDGREPTDEGEDEQETDDIDTTLSVIKESDVPEGSLAKEGQVIHYTITVTNEGNVPYTNVQVTDELENLTIDESDCYTVDGHVVTIDTLEVDEVVTITASYTVTADDLPAAHVKNVAKAEADPIDDPKHPGEEKTPKDEDEVDVILGTDVTVKVHWVDGDQFYRPAEGMPVQLIGNNGEVIAEAVVDPRTMGTDWVYTFKDVPINDGNGDPIVYTVREPVAPGNGRYDVEHDGLEVTNTAYVTVTFVGWNGIVLQSERLLLGASTTAPADPIRVGHRFTGWTGGVKSAARSGRDHASAVFDRQRRSE